MDERLRISVVDYPVYKVHEFVLWDIVEELFEVDVHDVCVSVIEVFEQFHYCLLCSALRSESKAVITE